MRFSQTLAAAAIISIATAAPAPASPTATDAADVHAAAATAKSESPTSKVKGKAFDRYVSIWLENNDFDTVKTDPNFQFFAQMGILQTKRFAVTHPSEPNYMSVVAGDYFGLDGDPFIAAPQNISTVVDLLEDKGISWSIYEEDMPYTGFQGIAWVNQSSGANDYVRKHDPLVIFNSVANSPDRLEKLKNFTLFYEDLKANKLPQWIFITPNEKNDGHDTSAAYAGAWLRGFLEPLLSDTNFMDNTLIMVTFDENETYEIQNNIFGLLLGDSVPKELEGTTDDNYYNHYSEISTVEANWDLHTLGRWDVGANVFAYVAAKTGDRLRKWSGEPEFSEMFFNSSYPGIFNSKVYAPQPVPDCHSRRHGRTTLDSIKDYWISKQSENYYHGQLEIPDGSHPPKLVT